MSTLTLALVIHNHQPVGNFEHVFAEATDKAYAPMLAALVRHPNIRMSLHYSGPLLDWLDANRPDLLELLGDLVSREQVELLTGGYYEPILVSVPDADKLGQVRKMTDFLMERFGYGATGAWISERVWEPHLPKTLAEAGVQYTLLDDTPFKMAGLTDADLLGSYITEEQGFPLKIFGNVKHLRYAIPWHSVEKVIDWLKGQARACPGGVAVSGDDGEKFGMWCDTFNHCWGENGWVNHFFTALEDNVEWVRTRPLGEVAAEQAPLGRIYLPCSSYEEMMHWALPPDAFVSFGDLKRALQDAEETRGAHRFVTGTSWRSFVARYDEVNQMHKKMLWVSRKVHAMPEGEAKRRALDHIWSAQCNCGYWHGLFGGVYLFHIRAANFAGLITAENLADRSARGASPDTRVWATVKRADFDADGSDEILLNTDRQVLILKPSQGGALIEWDWRDRACNLLNTMTRRREGHHEMLRRAAERGRLILPGEQEIPGGVRVKEPDVHTRLFYDRHRRVALLDRFLGPRVTPEAFYQARYKELGSFVDQAYRAEIRTADDSIQVTLSRDGAVSVGEVCFPVRVEKTIRVSAGSPEFSTTYLVTNLEDIPVSVRFGIEFNWGIVGSDGPRGYLRVGSRPHSLSGFGYHDQVSTMTVGSTEPVLAGEVRLSLARPASLWRLPVETVSNSEAGYERTYQGTCTFLWWDILLEPELAWKTELTFRLIELEP